MTSDDKEKFILNDEKSFEQLYVSHARKLYRFCCYYIKNQEDAKEIIQEIFQSLWERRDQVEINVPIEQYLKKAIKLRIFKYFRDKSVREKHVMSFLNDQTTDENTTENSIMYYQLSDQIEILVDSLPDKTGEIFRLSRHQGLSHKEIAGMLLISEKAVEYHITKTIAFLRRALSE
jgi:RNA polymerase sigma-70 factor (family 1)